MAAPPTRIVTTGTNTPKGSVKQAASPTQIARNQGIANQQRQQALGAADPGPRSPAYQPNTNIGGGTTVPRATASGNAGNLVGSPPAQLSLANANAVNDYAAMGGPQFQLSQIANTPGAQNAGSGLPNHGTDIANWTFDGSSTTFSPRDLETMLNDPYSFQRQFLQSRGMNTPGANSALGQYASRLNPLSMILGGANMQPDQQGNLEALAELYEGLMDNYTTPGGRMPDLGEIMQILSGVGNIENGGQASSLLQALLAGEDPEGQVSAIQQMLGATLAGQPGLWGRAWSNMLDQAGTSYLDSTMDSAQGPNATMLDYLRNDPFFSRIR